MVLLLFGSDRVYLLTDPTRTNLVLQIINTSKYNFSVHLNSFCVVRIENVLFSLFK